MASPLEDLDELILRCHNEKARSYIGEAVASYRAGAFRASIVACWVAVCFDVIEKLRELALAGVKEAELQMQALERSRSSADVSGALKFERELLKMAQQKFELLSPLEVVDLERLQHDRNRCAHPSMSAEDQVYAPPAELARLHIHSAVTHLLQHPPVQGKEALSRLISEVESDYFPSTLEKAHIAFLTGPLRKPRDSLVRSFVLVLVKERLGGVDFKKGRRIVAALQAVRKMHPRVFNDTMSQRLSEFIRKVEDKDLRLAINFILSVKDLWHFLDPAVLQRIQNYVRELPASSFEMLETYILYPELRESAVRRIRSSSFKEISEADFLEMPKEVADRLIELYVGSPSFDDANARGKYLMSVSGDFSADQIRRVLTNSGRKPDVVGSFQLEAVIKNLRSRQKLPAEEFEQLLVENDLGKYALRD